MNASNASIVTLLLIAPAIPAHAETLVLDDQSPTPTRPLRRVRSGVGCFRRVVMHHAVMAASKQAGDPAGAHATEAEHADLHRYAPFAWTCC